MRGHVQRRPSDPGVLAPDSATRSPLEARKYVGEQSGGASFQLIRKSVDTVENAGLTIVNTVDNFAKSVVGRTRPLLESAALARTGSLLVRP